MTLKPAMAAASVFAAMSFAPEAGAQRYGRHYGHHPYAERSAYQLDRLRYVLRDGVRSGAVTRWEARRLFPQLRDLRRLRARYITTRGMSEREAYALRARIGDFRRQVHQAVWEGRGLGRYYDRDYRDDWHDDRGRGGRFRD